MKLLWLYLLAYLMLPIVGEILLLITKEEISAGSVSLDLVIHNIIFVFCIIVIAVYISQINYNNIKRIFIIDNYKDLKKIFNKTIILLTLIAIFIFVTGGYKIVLGLANRGEVRASLGLFGPFYTLALSYLTVGVFIYVSIIYTGLPYTLKKLLKKRVILIYSFAFILGYFSGYKAVALTLLIPALVVLYYDSFSIAKITIFIIFSIVILTIFTSIVRNMDIVNAFYFLIHRMTVMTAYGTIGVWNHYSEGVSFEDILINYIGVFGQKISSLLLHIAPTEPEFLKTNLSRLITYKVYPDAEGALSGSVNVTVTNFGHAIYILGKYLYIIYAVIMGLIIGIVLRLFKIYIIYKKALLASIIGIYFFSVIIPSINSGGIFTLISLPSLVYILISYTIIKYYLGGKIV